MQIRRKGRQLSPVLPHLGAKLSNLKRCAVSLIQDDALEAAKIVLFTNPNADLSKYVRAHPEVATFNNITEKLDSSLQHFEKLSSEAMNNYEALSSSFATWDQIKFDGGNISCGDFDDSMMPKKWARKDFRRISIKVSLKSSFSLRTFSLRMNALPGDNESYIFFSRVALFISGMN